MAIKAKSKRRLIILLGVIILFAGGMGGLWAHSRAKLQNKSLDQLAKGRVALAAGNHFDAMDAIGSYVHRHPEDSKALYEYSQARLKVEEPNADHLIQGVGVLRRVVELEPNHTEAMHKLMDLYVKLGYATEGGELADKLLRRNPDDMEAVWSKALILTRMRQYNDALKLVKRFNKQEPLDFDGNVLRLSIMRGLEMVPDEIVKAAADLLEQHPEDPRFELLLAIAHSDANHRDEAVEWCKRAAEREAPNTDFVMKLAGVHDRLGLYQQSFELLKRYANDTEDQAILRAYVRRLSDAEQPKQVVERLAHLSSDDRNSDSEMLALKTLALFQLGRRDEAQTYIDALDERKQDNTAQAWSMILDEVVRKDKLEVSKVIEVCQNALLRLDHPYFHHYLARAYALSEEAELALDEWIKAVRLAPHWQTPITYAAKVLVATGRGKMATVFWELLTKQPSNIETIVTITQIWSANLEEFTDDSTEKLLGLIEQVQLKVPAEPRTLPIYVELLAGQDRLDEAREQIQNLLDAKDPPGENLLIRLAEVSRKTGLGLEDACLSRIEEAYGVSMQLAFTRAVQMANDGHAQDGLLFLENGAKSSDQPDHSGWQLAIARFMEVINDPRAAGAWIAMADERPENRFLQLQAIKARSTWSDGPFIDRAIERVRKLAGEGSPTWRVARARWLLYFKKDVKAAATLLKDVIRDTPRVAEARTLLAACHRMQGNISAALDELNIAERLAADREAIALRKARLYQSQGKHEQVATVLNEVLDSRKVTPAHKREVAQLLAQQGETERAIEILEKLYEDDSAPADLLLARLYRRVRMFDKTEATCRRLLENPTPAIISFTGDFFASRGMMNEAMTVMGKLDELELSKGRHAMLLAAFQGHHVSASKAVETYHTGIAAEPLNGDLRRSLIIFLLQTDRTDDAVEAVHDAASTIPDDKTFRFLEENAELVSFSKSHIYLRTLAIAMVTDVKHRQVAAQALGSFHRHSTTNAAREQLVAEFREMADQNTRFLPVHIITGRIYLAMGLADEAIVVSTRVMQSFPNRVDPIWLATEALAAAGRNDEALDMAKKWRQRSADKPLNADMMIADLDLKLGYPKETLDRLEPYTAAARQNPDAYTSMILLQARAHVADGNADEAARELWPLVSRSPGWKTAWIALATDQKLSEKTTAIWLDKIANVIEPDDFTALANLAQGWQTLANRADNKEYTRKALEIILPATKKPNALPGAILMAGVLYDNLGNFMDAERNYKKVLELKPNMAIAQNNMAMLISRRGGDLDEALRFAQLAVSAVPNNASFRDTLAYVQGIRGEHKIAIENLEVAMQLEPDNVLWPINITDHYLQSGDVQSSMNMIDRIDSVYVVDQKVPKEVREKLLPLRERVAEAQKMVP